MRIAIFGTTYDHHYNQCLQDVVNILGSNGASIIFEKTFHAVALFGGDRHDGAFSS